MFNKRELRMWAITTTDQTKAKSQRYTILTHAGLRLQSNKDLAPCTPACQLLKIPRQKWGDIEYVQVLSSSSNPETGKNRC